MNAALIRDKEFPEKISGAAATTPFLSADGPKSARFSGKNRDESGCSIIKTILDQGFKILSGSSRYQAYTFLVSSMECMRSDVRPARFYVFETVPVLQCRLSKMLRTEPAKPE